MEKEWEATVVSNYNVATYIKEFIVEIPEDMDYKAGGYIQIKVPAGEVTLDMDIKAHPKIIQVNQTNLKRIGQKVLCNETSCNENMMRLSELIYGIISCRRKKSYVKRKSCHKPLG